MSRKVLKYDDVVQELSQAIETIAGPVVQTLSPKGGNVMFNDGTIISNDGISIARSIRVADYFQDSIIRTIRESCVRTNSEAGDGTTTSILLTSVMLKEGMRLKSEGFNGMEITRTLREASKKLLGRIKEQARVIKDDKELFNVARISANNDDKIAKTVVDTVKVAGLDGMVFIEPNNKPEDEIESNVGFNIKAGMFRPEFRTHGFAAMYSKVPVLITDKRLYYKAEAEAILRSVYDAGYKEVVVVARDFLGDCLNFLTVNHTGGAFKVLLIKEPDATDQSYESLEDLAAYLDSRVVTEKAGNLVDNITIKDFAIADRVFSDGQKSLLSKENKKKANPQLVNLLDSLRKELAKKPKDKDIERRIANLTSGMATIKVGAATQQEMQERIYRFEDSVNATRAAMRHGYLPGGGIAIMNAFNDKDYPEDYRTLFRRYTEAGLRQIARNCGKDPDTIVERVKHLQEDLDSPDIGYDALTDDCVNMIQVGIIDPYQVLQLAIENSVSAACNILSVNYFVVEENKEEDDKK